MMGTNKSDLARAPSAARANHEEKLIEQFMEGCSPSELSLQCFCSQVSGVGLGPVSVSGASSSQELDTEGRNKNKWNLTSLYLLPHLTTMIFRDLGCCFPSTFEILITFKTRRF